MNPSEAGRALVDRIYRLMSQRDFQAAGRLCEQLTNEHPGYDLGWIAAAEFFLRVNNPARALEMVQQAVRLTPDNINWALQQARCLLECGRTDDSIAATERITASGGPLSPQQHNELGMLLARLDQHEASQAHYRQAVAAQPGETEFLFNLATSQRFLGETAAAEATLLPEFPQAGNIRFDGLRPGRWTTLRSGAFMTERASSPAPSSANGIPMRPRLRSPYDSSAEATVPAMNRGAGDQLY